MYSKLFPATATLTLAALLASCGGGGSSPAAVTPPAPTPPQSLTLSGDTSRVLLGGAPVTLTATPAVAASLTWALDSGPGTLSGTSGNSVTYTPPACCAPGHGNSPVSVSVKAGGVTQSFNFWVYPPTPAPGLSLIGGTLGGSGNLDGKGDLARFSEINDITADASGNLLVIDTLHSYADSGTSGTRVRRVSASGEVTTLGQDAGRTALGISAAPDGTVLLLVRQSTGLAVYQMRADGSSVPLLSPAQTDQSTLRLVAGLNGTVYMVGNRQITVARADGSGGVLAGNGNDTSPACRDGAGSDARLSRINDAVLDRAGNLLVADCYSVRKITPTGVVSTIAGDLSDSGAARDGSGAAAHFYGWRGSLAVDQNGELRVLDYDFPQFNDDGSGKPIPYRLRKVSATGVVTTLLSASLPGSGDFKLNLDQQTVPGVPGAYKFVRYLADGTAVVATPAQLYTLNGSSLRTLAGNEGELQAGSQDGARLLRPQALGANADGTLYVRDAQGSYYQITRSGVVSAIAQDSKQWAPATQLLHRAEGLYVNHVTPLHPYDRSQTRGAVIELRRAIDQYLTGAILAGSRQELAYDAPRVDGPGKDATFWKADLLGFDAAGNLYVEDEKDGKPLYRQIKPDGMVTTVSALPSDLDAARQGSGIIQNGYRHVYDMQAGLVYRIAPGGSKTVVAGTAGQYGNRVGALPGSLVGVPYGADSAPTVPLTAIGPDTYALISGAAVLQLVVPPTR